MNGKPKVTVSPCHQCDTCPLEVPVRSLIHDIGRLGLDIPELQKSLQDVEDKLND